MKQLTKLQAKYLTNLFGLTQKDMPIGIDKKHFLEHLKGNYEFFCYDDFYLSIRFNYDNLKNSQKIDMIGRQMSFILAEALEDEHYELCKNLAKYFEKINFQIEIINSYILNRKVNG
jgi:hypothetical protein